MPDEAVETRCAEAYLIANNRTSEKGGWEERMLAEVLTDVRDADQDLLAATGYTDEDLARSGSFRIGISSTRAPGI
jgi:hypothetical protein